MLPKKFLRNMSQPPIHAKATTYIFLIVFVGVLTGLTEQKLSPPYLFSSSCPGCAFILPVPDVPPPLSATLT